MKLIVLAKPSVPASSDEVRKGLYPPLGLLYLSAVARGCGFETRVYDLDLYSREAFIEECIKLEPDYIGFTSVTTNCREIRRIINELRRAGVKSRIIVGGPHATLVPEDFEGYADYIVVGEGEFVLRDILESRVRRDGGSGSIVVRGGHPPLDSLPQPDRDSIDLRAYGENMGALMTSRGCPYNCLFCVARFIMGRKFRGASVEKVVSEWRRLRREYNAPKIRIVDDVFTFDRERAKEIMKRVKEESLGPWSLPNGVRVDNVDEEIIKLMAESGCTTVWYGVESGDQRVINVLRKGIRLERVEEVVKLTKKYGVRVGLFFMIGAPGETLESVYKTIRFIEKVEPDYLHFSIATPYPRTDFWRWVEEHGRFLTTDYELFEKQFIFETPEYPLRDRLKAIEIIEKELSHKFDIEI